MLNSKELNPKEMFGICGMCILLEKEFRCLFD